MSETRTLKVDTGSVMIAVEDKGEKIGEFRFNPSDIDIARRYEKVVEVLEGISISDDPTPEEVFSYTDKVKEQFDYLLNYKVSDALFAKCNPLTMLTNGDFYCESILDGIAGLIEDATNQRIAKKKAKVRKATAKYHK